VDRPLTFGAFIAPFHPVGQNPTLAIERDLELVVRLDVATRVDDVVVSRRIAVMRCSSRISTPVLNAAS